MERNNNPLGLRSLAEMHEKGFAEVYKQRFKDAISLDWYFSGWEKILIVACFLYTFFSVGRWVWKLV